MAKLTLPKEEYLHHGHNACPGCGAPLALRYTLKALGPRTVINVPAGCTPVIAGVFPRYSFKIPMVDHPFECTGAVSSGIRAGLDTQGVEDATVLGWAGDGGTVDIGLQALSGAVDRGTDFVYLMLDNEAYMNTGIQCSGATPMGAWTTTTPTGKRCEINVQRKKRIMDMMVANGIVYGATVNIAYPEDFVKRVRKAKEIEGPAFIHALSPCSPGWRVNSAKTVEIARLATKSNMFPLYEVEQGEYRLNKEIKKKVPVSEYLKMQGRFRRLDQATIDRIQEMVDREYEELMRKVSCSQG
ncbi:MAG: thiamine pyrophosphate-dependent enzyme [Methanomassiliicoccales archaeon]